MNSMELTYRLSGAEGAGGVSLLLSLFDRLAIDLRRGADAQRAGDLERRGRELNHALAIIGFLENWIDRDSGALAEQLTAFYSRLRRGIIVALAKQSAAMLEEEIAATLKIREVWQQTETCGAPTRPEILPPAPANSDGFGTVQTERSRLSWSA